MEVKRRGRKLRGWRERREREGGRELRVGV